MEGEFLFTEPETGVEYVGEIYKGLWVEYLIFHEPDGTQWSPIEILPPNYGEFPSER